MLTLCLALCAGLICACAVTQPSSVASQAPSSTAPSQTASPAPTQSSESVVSAVPDPSYNSQSGGSIPYSDPSASQPTQSVPTLEDDTAYGEARANQFVAQFAALGYDDYSIHPRLKQAAHDYIDAVVEAGVDYLNNTDYKTMPDGSRIGSLINNADSGYPKLSGIGYSIWINQVKGDSNTAAALVQKAVEGERFAQQAAKGYKYVAAAVHTELDGDGVPLYTVLSALYATDEY